MSEPGNISFSHLSIVLLVPLSVLFNVMNIFLHIFAINRTDNGITIDYNFKACVANFLCCLLVFVGFSLLKKVVSWYHEKYEKNEKELLKTLWTIGFGGVGFGAFLPEILLWFEGPNELIQYYCFITYPFMLAVLYFKFLYLFLSKCQFFFRGTYLHAKLVCFFMFGHFYLLGVFGAISYIFFPNPDEKLDRNLAGYQMLMSMPAGIGTTECFLVAVGAIEWRKEEKKEGVNDSRIECKICLEEYSEERPARILKECGHTICHKCVINLMARNSNTHLFCPTCQQMTVTSRTAYSLRENRVVMSIVKKLKQ